MKPETWKRGGQFNLESKLGDFVRLHGVEYVIVEKHKANSVRPRQYPLRGRYRDARLFKLKDRVTGEMLVLVVTARGDVELVGPRKTKGKKS